MSAERLQRLALQWGGLAVVAQVWIALAFVRGLLEDVELLRSTPTVEMVWDRSSQLKPPFMKFPAVGVYLVLFAAVVGAILAVAWFIALKTAMQEQETRDP